MKWVPHKALRHTTWVFPFSHFPYLDPENKLDNFLLFIFLQKTISFVLSVKVVRSFLSKLGNPSFPQELISNDLFMGYMKFLLFVIPAHLMFMAANFLLLSIPLRFSRVYLKSTKMPICVQFLLLRLFPRGLEFLSPIFSRMNLINREAQPACFMRSFDSYVYV